jgi:hypothetical protein
MKKLCAMIISALLLLSIISGCSGSPGDMLSSSIGRGRENADSAPAERWIDEETVLYSTAGESAPQNTARKVIFNYYHNLETKDMAAALVVIEQATAFSGGYIENSSYSDRGSSEQFGHARIVCRIPVTNAGDFKNVVENAAHVRSKSEQGRDVTDEYFDAEVRVATLTTQEARLLEMLRHSEILSDLLELERELARVRTEIERLTGTLRQLDNQVTLATFTIDIRLVEEYTENDEPSFARTMGNAVTGSLYVVTVVIRVTLIMLIYMLPYLIASGVIVAVVLYIRRRVKNKKKAKNSEE